MTSNPRIRVLIVDDDNGMAKYFQGYLVRRMFEVSTAGSGEEGFVCFVLLDHRVVLLDMAMPA